MTVETADDAIRIGKEWIGRENAISTDSIKVVSCARNANYWSLVLSFYAFTEPRKFSLMISDEGKVVKIQQVGYSTESIGLGSAPTMILIAYIFSMLVLVAYGIYVVILLFLAASPLVAAGVFLIALIPVVLFIVGLWVFLRVGTIRRFMESGDARSAYEANTVGLGVVALIFNGVVTGILLLLSREDLRRAAEQQ